MSRVVSYKPMKCGAKLRIVTVTWNRAEVLARVQAVHSFKHKRLIVKGHRYEAIRLSS